ncbi:MAG: hypothetical protein ACTHN5_14215 [Phycisphaerae bacterium]
MLALLSGALPLESIHGAVAAGTSGVTLNVAVHWSGAAHDGSREATMLPLAAKNLQQRLDPQNSGEFEVIRAGTDRLSLRILLGPDEAKAYQEARDAGRAFEKSVLNPETVRKALCLEGEKRDAAIDAIAPLSSPRNAALKRLASALDESRAAATAAENSKAPIETDQERLEATSKALGVAAERVGSTTLTAEAAEAIISSVLASENRKTFARLDQLPAEYPDQADAIRRLIAARTRLFKLSGKPDGPREIEALINARGLLEFRIGVQSGDLSPLSRALALQTLVMDGGRKGISLDQGVARWFALHPQCDWEMHEPVTVSWCGSKYVLLRADDKGSLTHAATQPAWTASVGEPYIEPLAGLVMPFQLDKVGGAAMGRLTSQEIGHSMAVLVDNRPLTIPFIAARLEDRGVITFGRVDPNHSQSALRQRAGQLYRLISQGDGPIAYEVLP